MQREQEFNRLRAFLTIDSLNIDTEFERMPMILMEALEERAKASEAMESAKNELAVVTAVETSALSEHMGANGKPRSATSINAELPMLTTILEAKQIVSELRLELDLWGGLCDAMRQKAHSLKGIADMTIAGYTATPTAYERNKERMAEGRAGVAERHRPRRVISE